MTDDNLPHARSDRHTTARDAGESRRRDPATRSLPSSRRQFLGAAAAGAGALALPTVGGSVAASGGGLPELYVEGPRIVDASGEEVPLRGVTVADPKELNRTAPARGKDAGQVLDLLTDPARGWHPTVVRVPVRPRNVAEREPVATGGTVEPGAFDAADLESYLDEHLDPVIERLEAAGAYAIVDFQRWDRDGAVEWTDDALDREIRLFWDTVAPRYADDSHVLYELYGLPTEPGMWGDPTEEEWVAERWRQWIDTAQPWIDLIRRHAPETVVIVGSPGWNLGPDGTLLERFDGANLAYAYHSYPGVGTGDEETWAGAGPAGQGTLGVAEDVPVFVTEFGWNADLEGAEVGDPAFPFEGTTSGYGEPFVEWLESQPGVYWTASTADPGYPTRLFSLPFADESHEELGELDPYHGEVPELCPEPPCEWALLGEDVGDFDDHAGAFVRKTLGRLQADAELSAPSVTRPRPPASVEVIDDPTPSVVPLGWEPVDDASEYRILVDGAEHARVETTGHPLQDLDPGTEYRVGVQAVSDGHDRPSVPYATTVSTAKLPRPAAPRNVRFSVGVDGDLVVSWDGVERAAQYVVTLDGEEVARSDQTSTPVQAGLYDEPGQIAVHARNASGRRSETAGTARYDAPATVDVVDRTGDAIALEWSDVDGAAGYDVFAVPHEVPLGNGNRPNAALPDREGVIVAQSASAEGTVDGLDPLQSYDVGVAARGEFGARSRVTTTRASTDATEEQSPVPTVSVDLADEAVPNGGSTTATLTLSAAPDGVVGFTVEVAVDDTAVATVGDVAFPTAADGSDAFGLTQELAAAEDGAWVTLDAVDVVDSVDPGATDVELATVDLDAVGLGATDVSVAVHTITPDSEDNDAPARTDGARLSVGVADWGGSLTYDGEEIVPEDLNGDGRYRDVTGSGSVTQTDVLAFFENFQGQAVQSNAAAFDYTGNGTVGHADVVSLFEYVVSS